MIIHDAADAESADDTPSSSGRSSCGTCSHDGARMGDVLTNFTSKSLA